MARRLATVRGIASYVGRALPARLPLSRPGPDAPAPGQGPGETTRSARSARLRGARRLLLVGGLTVAGWLLGGAVHAAADTLPTGGDGAVRAATAAPATPFPGPSAPPASTVTPPAQVTQAQVTPVRPPVRPPAHPQISTEHSLTPSGASSAPSPAEARDAAESLWKSVRQSASRSRDQVRPQGVLGLPAQIERAAPGGTGIAAFVGNMDGIASRVLWPWRAGAGSAVVAPVSPVASPAGSGASMRAAIARTGFSTAPPRHVPGSPDPGPQGMPSVQAGPSSVGAGSGPHPLGGGYPARLGPADLPRAVSAPMPGMTVRALPAAVDEPSFSPD